MALREKRMGRNGPPPPGFPDDLPEGTTLLDMPDHEVLERAQVFAQLFEGITEQLEDYIAAGCPDDDDSLMRSVTMVLYYNLDAFRGAEEWRAQHEAAARTALEQGALRGNPDDIPESLLAAFWCDVALRAEETFWATVREHAEELGEPELLDENLRRSRAH
jgi:hypothetical protein